MLARLLLLAASLALSAPAFAHAHHTAASQPSNGTSAPREAGQSAFASDASKFRALGFIGIGSGVTWCIIGLDRNHAFSPNCRAAGP